jgi:hypothetical protein
MLKNSARRRWRVAPAVNTGEMPWLALLFPKPWGPTVKRFSAWLDLGDYFPSLLGAARRVLEKRPQRLADWKRLADWN